LLHGVASASFCGPGFASGKGRETGIDLETRLNTQRSFTFRLQLVMLFGLATAMTLSEPASAREPEPPLDGTRYVLVHYRDAADGRADVDLWHDRIWIFKSHDERLTWTDFPVVVFKNDRKRFQTLHSGRKVRAESSWLPSAKQHREIREGLQVTTLGQRTKTLRGDARQGYRVQGASRPGSASVIGFNETWEVLDPSGLPAFVRSDAMDSVRTESLVGATRFDVRIISDDGRRLEGDFDRDGTQRGTFQMIRAGEVTIMDADEESRDKRR
jgi:hypothetical protein